jgi:hypothetical protein
MVMWAFQSAQPRTHAPMRDVERLRGVVTESAGL